jgi:2-polyprenyl-3-methyl-5-hydroxy-6-metoxy-1,4-benzoquinol methylase
VRADLARACDAARVDDGSHYRWLAACFARGALGRCELDDDAAIAAAEAAGLRMHRFKRTGELPRVRAVIGALRGLGATSLVDVGSGRGAFLWPMLDAMPGVTVIAIDVLPHRVAALAAVARGGVDGLAAARMDIARVALADRCADVVTVLEVLEHLPDPAPTAHQAIRLARSAVVVTVPSHEDDNPEHLRVFTAASLTALFTAAGARRVTIDHVRGHLLAVAMR